MDKMPLKLILELVAGVPPMFLLALAFAWMTGASWTIAFPALGLYILLAAGLAWLGRARICLGWPNRLTLLRAMLVILLAAALTQHVVFIEAGWSIGAVALVVLALDGLDGWLARTLDQESAFGARFDMEVDAALILFLCLGLALSGKVGAWVLAIGLLRYAFAASTVFLPWLARPLPDSFRRKLVCVWQVISLLVVATGLTEPAVTATILASALALLVYSFAVDVVWLRRQHDSSPTPIWRMS